MTTPMPSTSGADPWHWQEIDLTKWLTEVLNERFRRKTIMSTETSLVATVSARSEGEAILNTRKGKKFVIASLDVIIKLTAKCLLNGSVIASIDGDVTFSSVGEVDQPEDWPVRVRVGNERPNPGQGLNAPAVAELNPHDKTMKRMIEDKAVPVLRREVTELLLEMQSKASGKENSSSNGSKDISVTGTKGRDSTEACGIEGDEKETSSSFAVRSAIERLAANDPLCTNVLLSGCKLSDKELLQLSSAIRENEYVTEIDLRENDISDVGVQTLVAALANSEVAPKLSLMKLNDNPSISQIGMTIIHGMRIIRKNVNIEI